MKWNKRAEPEGHEAPSDTAASRGGTKAPADTLREILAIDAWGDLPNAVALDRRVSAATLILLALRTTLLNFSLGSTGLNAAVRGGGLGRNVVERANAEAVSLGLLDRRQPGGRPGAKFRYCVERLTLPEPGEQGCRKVQRSWFRGILSLNELASLLYMRAAGPALRRQLVQRFRWTPPTAMAVLRALERHGLVTSVPSRTRHGAFGPTAYAVIQRVPQDLDAVVPAASEPGAPETDQPGKLRSKAPGHGNPGHGNPGRVHTATQDNLSELNLAALDSDLPPQTSQSEDSHERTPPPSAPSSAPRRQKKDLPSARKKVLRDWRSAPYFRKPANRPIANVDDEGEEENVTDLAGWRAMLQRHGCEPEHEHLRTPWAHKQAELLTQHLACTSDRVTLDAVLDAVAFWTAEAVGRGRSLGTLALIGQSLHAALMRGSAERIFARPSSLPAARYEEVSQLASEWAATLGNYTNVDVASLTSTLRVEQLSDMIERYGRAAVVEGIDWTTKPWRDAGERALPNRTIHGWRYFEAGIDAAASDRANSQERQRQQRVEWDAAVQNRCQIQDDYRARLTELAPFWVDRLAAEGTGIITGVRREKLTSADAIRQLAAVLIGSRVEIERADAVMQCAIGIIIAQCKEPQQGDRAKSVASWRATAVREAAVETQRKE